MTTGETIALANKAGWSVADLLDGFGTRLERFTKLVAAAEREACALICDEHADDPVYCGNAIRARGEQP